MVDYRKFDDLVKEELELERQEQQSRPLPDVSVTKLNAPARITISNQDHVVVNEQPLSSQQKGGLTASYAKWDQWAKEEHGEIDEGSVDSNDVDSETLRNTITQVQQLNEADKQSHTSKPEAKIKNLTENGAETEKFFWSQTADEVLLRVKCEKAVKARDVNVQITRHREIKVTVWNKVILCGALKYNVWDDDLSPFSSEEERFQKEMKWEMEDIDESSRCITIILIKRAPYEGVRVWWKRIFTETSGIDEEEIDVQQIASRSRTSIDAMQNVWKQAHEMFLTNRAREREEREAQTRNQT